MTEINRNINEGLVPELPISWEQGGQPRQVLVDGYHPAFPAVKPVDPEVVRISQESERGKIQQVRDELKRLSSLGGLDSLGVNQPHHPCG